MARGKKMMSVAPETAARDEAQLPGHVLESILRAGLSAPHGPHGSALEFIVVREPEALRRMAGCRVDTAHEFAGAVCAIVVLGDEFANDIVIEEAAIAVVRMQFAAMDEDWRALHILCRLRTSASGEPTEVFLRKLLSFPAARRLCGILLITPPVVVEKVVQKRDVLSENIGRVHWESYAGVTTG